MNTKLQTLYRKSKTGATVQYTVWTEGAEVVTEYGQVSGQMQISRQTAVAKNVGRSNETTACSSAVVREYEGVYRYGHRSNKLLKVKSFMDSEYKITGFTTGVGRFEGSVIWTCVNEDGKSFNVVPQGTMEERQATYEVANDHIGDLLKVKYFELTDDGIPRFPVGLGVRLAEDMQNYD